MTLVDSDRGHWRPKTRADCDLFPRPCPYVGCRYHLLLDVDRHGTIQSYAVNASLRADGSLGQELVFTRALFPALKKARYTCALDAADSGMKNRIVIGEVYGVGQERVRQMEDRAIKHAQRNVAAESEGPVEEEAG